MELRFTANFINDEMFLSEDGCFLCQDSSDDLVWDDSIVLE